MEMVAVEIDGGSLIITIIGAMASALTILIFCYLAFRVSLESRLKDLERPMEILADLEEAFFAQEERIRDLEMEASRMEALPRDGMTCPVARGRSMEDERVFPRDDLRQGAKKNRVVRSDFGSVSALSLDLADGGLAQIFGFILTLVRHLLALVLHLLYFFHRVGGGCMLLGAYSALFMRYLGLCTLFCPLILADAATGEGGDEDEKQSQNPAVLEHDLVVVVDMLKS